MSDETSPSESPRPPALPAPEPGPATKSPVLAAALTFLFPGVGQVYNGQATKALVFFTAFVASISLVASGEPLPFAFGIPFAFFYSMIDAYRSAILINARRAGRPLEPLDEEASAAWGWALIALGGLLLLNNLGWLNLWAVRRFWPLLLIVAGAFVIRNALRRRDGAGGEGPAA
jgi:LiaI-LiaF-like transmembrane region